MGNHDYSRAFLLVFFDNFHEQTAINGVEAFGGFVENEQFRVVDDSQAKLNFLLLPAREFVEANVGFVALFNALQIG